MAGLSACHDDSGIKQGSGATASSSDVHTVSGTVSGVKSDGLILQGNGKNLRISSNGNYTFAEVSTGDNYKVTVQINPEGELCTVANGTGSVGDTDVNSVAVTCQTNSFKLSATVTGLAGSGLVLQTNGANDVSASANGTYTLAQLSAGAAYAVTVATQPSNPTQTCTVTHGSGTMGAADISSVAVTCKTSDFVTAAQFANKSLRGFSAPGDTSMASLTTMATTGANLARVFLNLVQSGTSYSVEAASLTRLDAVIAAGAQLGFKVVICFFPPDNGYFASTALQTSIAANWQVIAKRYKDNVTVAGYDVMNEPISPAGAAAWNTMATGWISIIRKIDPDHVIIFEPSPGAVPEAFNDLQPLAFDNIVYSVHMYEPYQFTHQGILYSTPVTYPATTSSVGAINKDTVSAALQPVRDFVSANNVPMFVGEFGAVRWAPSNSSNTYISDLITLMEAVGWSWTYNSWTNYQGWDAEIPESWFYAMTITNAKPQGFETIWPPPRTTATDTMAVFRYVFQRNSN